MTNILITGVGGPTPIGIAKSLLLADHNIRLIGVDADRFAPGLYRNDIFANTYQVPHASKTSYWDYIHRIIEKEQIDYAFVVPEREVLVWAKRKEQYSLPCGCLIPDQDIAEFLYNKLRVSDALKPLNLVPNTLRLKRDEGDGNISLLGKTLGYPYWIRAAEGAGALGALKINSEEDLRNWISMLPNTENLIGSTYLPGKNYACKVLAYKGRIVLTAAGERIDYLLSAAAPSGVSGMCARGRLLNNYDLVERSVNALRYIHGLFDKEFHGMFTVDFKAASDGTPLITEINIRHVSFTYAFSLGGANFAAKTLEVFHQNKSFASIYHQFDDSYHFFRGVDNALQLHKESDLKSLEKNFY